MVATHSVENVGEFDSHFPNLNDPHHFLNLNLNWIIYDMFLENHLKKQSSIFFENRCGVYFLLIKFDSE